MAKPKPIQPVQVEENSFLVGQLCALCHAEIRPGDVLVICPEDETRHHVACWEANNNQCVSLGCPGRGKPGRQTISSNQIQEVEAEAITIGEQDPLLDPANLPKALREPRRPKKDPVYCLYRAAVFLIILILVLSLVVIPCLTFLFILAD